MRARQSQEHRLMSINSMERFVCRLAAAALAGVACFAVEAAAQAVPFEKLAPRPVAEVLPPAMQRGANFTVAPMVQNLGYMNAYTVNSTFGVFRANGDAMMRRLLREIAAIAALREMRGTEEFAAALGHAAMGSARGLKYVVTEPVATLKAIPESIVDVFSRAGEAVSRDKTRYEDSAVKTVLQVASNKRDYAAKLGVDVYSSNRVLQEELDSVGWAATGGQITMAGAFMAGAGSAAIQGLSYARNLDQARTVAAAEPPPELVKRNRAALAAMGIDQEQSKRFLTHPEFSPRHQTIIVASLQQLGGVQGLHSFLAVAGKAPSEEMALFYQQTAELLAGYHATVAPLARLEPFNRLVIARRKDGGAVVIAPVDYAIWTESAAKGLDAAVQRVKPSKAKSFELWITGVASPAFKTAAASRNVTVREQIGAKLPLLD
jgi:hypothetical protein